MLRTHIANTLHAIRTIFQSFTGIGRRDSAAHEGLKLKHFVIGGIVAALLLVGGLATLVRLIARHAV